jgi:hypothetical protein
MHRRYAPRWPASRPARSWVARPPIKEEKIMTHRPQEQQPRRAAQDPHPPEKDRRDSGEQSGSTGRNPGTGDHRQDGADTGQDRYGMTGGVDRNAPEPGHEAGSSGTSEYGSSDYGEPGDHERGGKEGSDRADRDETETRQNQSQSQSQKSPGQASPTRVRRSNVEGNKE